MAPNDVNNFNQNIIAEFRSNGGTVTSAPFGRTLVLVHHRGAKTGKERINPVMHLRQDADTWLIAASKAGAPDNPAWYANLIAHPETTIETPDDGIVEVRVEELVDAARDEAWERFKSASPGFQAYEDQTSRTIPVLALRRRV